MRFALFLSYWGVVENLRAKPPMMLGGRVGKDIKRKGGRGEDYHNKK
jgi:hypothetical protein